MSKTIRQNKILDIIKNNEIETQEELVDFLNALNFNVTQATVSRDIKELGLIKVNGKNRKRKYAVDEKNFTATGDDGLLHLFKACVKSIETAKNIVVVKTLGGNGNSAGVMIDTLNFEEIVGSVAGDDTVIIITKTDEDAFCVKNKLSELL